MSVEKIIEVSNVSMRFNLSQEKIDSIKEYFIKLVKKEIFYQEFMALKDVSFDIYRGEAFGMIGLNGAGKSTMLKIIAGVMKPSSGKVAVYGDMAPLIELGAGFDVAMTARENIILNGVVLGHSKKEMLAKTDEIIEFAELEQFIDVPLKNYSSGMVARLGFSIATTVKPEVLIVDEVLSVGDFKFQKKCEERIQSMREGGTTILFVSHSISQVRNICNRVLWLDKGQIKMIGEASEVCQAFQAN